MTKTAPKTSFIESSVRIGGRIAKAKGKTIEEAISKLKPEIKRGVGILVLEKGKQKKERILRNDMVQGLFGEVSRLRKEIALKNISNLFSKEVFE